MVSRLALVAASAATSPALARAELGKQLALGFEPVGVGIARQAESMSAFGNKIGAHPDFRVTRLERRRRRGFLVGGWSCPGNRARFGRRFTAGRFSRRCVSRPNQSLG